MIRFLKRIAIVACIAGSFTASAQVTTNSPYSQYGLGNIKGIVLPQNRAMGGIAVGLRVLGDAYNNINPANPASYSALRLTVFDIGAAGGLYELKKGNSSDQNFNATFGHLLFGVPINKSSAFSFGLMPYSDLGFRFKVSDKVDTSSVNYIYNGSGGLSKTYIGYGAMLSKHLSLGVNVGYLFGRLDKYTSTEFPNDPSALNSRAEYSNKVSGYTFDLGLQYSVDLSSKLKFNFGYTAAIGNNISSSRDIVMTHYRNDMNGDEQSAVDTLSYIQGAKTRIKMPVTNTFGFSFQKSNKWLLGADISVSNWSAYREGSANPGLQNSYRLSAGGQLTPDINSISSYWNLVDYRFGYRHEKTYININNTDIKQDVLSLGLGLPLVANRAAIYKINIAAELGKRGTLSNNLVRENFTNFHIGFLLNDKWFRKQKLD